MATTKIKTINNRPMIIVSLTTTKWAISLDKKHEVHYYIKEKEVHPKAETFTKGTYHVTYIEGWRETPILADGTHRTYWECSRQGTDFRTNSYTEALNRAVQARKRHGTGSVCLIREKETYCNPSTQQVTDDKAVAEKWFKGKNPLWISSSGNQKIGIWIDGGEGYVDVKFYYNNRIQRSGCGTWIEGKNSGVRIYSDGTISNFWKGKYYEPNRVYETQRVIYRGFDVRFPNMYRLSTLFLDLRAERLVGSDSDNRLLCKESIEILKKSGFPDTYWCWGSRKRPFEDTYDLVNFITHIQNKAPTKKGIKIEEAIADKPFNLQNLIIRMNKGILLRVPGYRESWKDNKGNHYDHYPSQWETSDPKPRFVKCGVVEKYRVWISDNGKKHTCQEGIHGGTCWSTVRWDSISWPHKNDGVWELGYADPMTEDDNLKRLKQQKDLARAEYNFMCGKLFSRLLEELPALSRYKQFLKEHSHFSTFRGVANLLEAIYAAPKLTETLIKTGYGDWFFTNGKSHSYYGEPTNLFALSHILDRFGLRGGSYCDRSLPVYEEKSGNTLYQNLQVTKEQFNWLTTIEYPGDFVSSMRLTSILIPGKQNEHYASFKDVPLKYLKVIYNVVEKLQDTSDSWYVYRKVTELLGQYQCTPADLEKMLARKLDTNLLIDYLRMRSSCTHEQGFNIAQWDKIPADPRDLSFCHDRILAFYNLALANRDRYYREEEEKRMIERQKLYAERYKKLKSFTYSDKDNDRCIVVPQKLIELVVEGQVLHHCVGSFATSVAEGRDTIVFLRHKDQPDVPYATISLLQTGKGWIIDQAHTAYNGRITEGDVAFLKKWGEKNNVEESSIQTNYGAKCHH